MRYYHLNIKTHKIVVILFTKRGNLSVGAPSVGEKHRWIAYFARSISPKKRRKRLYEHYSLHL